MLLLTYSVLGSMCLLHDSVKTQCHHSLCMPAYLIKQDDWKTLILFVDCYFVGCKGPTALPASATLKAHRHVYFQVTFLWYLFLKYYNYPLMEQKLSSHYLLCSLCQLFPLLSLSWFSNQGHAYQNSTLSAESKESIPQEQGEGARQRPQKSLLGTQNTKATLGERLAVLAKEERFCYNCHLTRTEFFRAK